MFSLKNKVAVVTGAGSGIGAAIAELFAEAGALVYVAECHEKSGHATAARIIQAGGRAKVIQVDITVERDCETLAERVLEHDEQRCDVLVNNAGIGHVGTILSTETADFEKLWQVNVRGLYFVSRKFLPAMVTRGRGSIINLGSVAAVTGMESRFAYTATKHAVLGMTRSMAMDFGTSGVRINCICPGRVQTPFVEARLKEYADPEAYLRQMVAPHAVKRLGTPREIAAAALFLACDESSFVTGCAFSVDGGYTTGK